MFLRSIKDSTSLDTTSKHCIRSELGVQKLSEKTEVNKANWAQNWRYRLLICILYYKPIGFKRHENTLEEVEKQLSRHIQPEVDDYDDNVMTVMTIIHFNSLITSLANGR
jgi:hypothetical protein